MVKRKEKEIRTNKNNLLVCKCHDDNGVPILEFIHQKKRDKMTVDELLKKIYEK
ncbi:hypothetical protein SAMN03080599_02283 [Acidaminobacter hydrogenoformans DSM 2784]|uniref:Uncharacterized protein n=1 Tax=Acidaminobacter hydrogenoformans DSM 2784 TaxID=1120920 RepID=A0A1G5S265_9FIRM|nr:hypothetical protein SAMN03080599_02283 [Acidaminobacter hydrogenoformans DSM 2784]